MIRKLGAILAAFFRRVTPDPFVLAIGLTVVTFGLALVLTPASVHDVVSAWQGPRGFYGLLSFSMQMCLILVTGHAVASAPVVVRLIEKLVAIPKSANAAGALVAFVAIFASLANWGLGLIVGAFLAREMGKSFASRGQRAHYPLFAAAGYAGLMTWHGGFSGSAPLKVTTEKDILELLGPELAKTVSPVSIFDTLLSPMNLFISGGLLLLVPVLVYFLTPGADDEVETIEAFQPKADAKGEGDSEASASSVPERLDRSPIVMALLALPLCLALVYYYSEHGIGRLDPNAVNLTLFTVGLILHGHPKAYVRAVERAVAGCAGIILQFPIYGGIMGMMSGTGLAKIFAAWAAKAASPATYAVFTFFSAAIINFFVPSGGGQWAVQGPIAAEAAATLGVSLERAVMSVAYGDQISNMLQPFWALPLLGITGVRAKDIIGYTAVFMIFGGLWMVLGLLVFV